MVYVNAKKYACEACIKGHRSSSCHHNDRPLFEIKKKGRPVSQCERCREARQARKIHAKCTCDSEMKASTSTDKVKLKGKRFIPSVPTLPNGLKDALKMSSSSSTEANTPKQPVDALLNPCNCKDVYNCKCRPRIANAKITLDTRPRNPVDTAIFSDGLSALALVASCCSPASPPIVSQPGPVLNKQTVPGVSSNIAAAATHAVHPISSRYKEVPEARPSVMSKRKRSPRCSPAPDPDLSDMNKPTSRRLRTIAPAPSSTRSSALPALVPAQIHVPALPSIPTLSTVSTNTALVAKRHTDGADSSFCCCGTRCECAGCERHGSVPVSQPSWVDDPEGVEVGPSTTHARAHGHGVNCAEACATCVDYEGGIELPSLNATRVSSESQTPAPEYLRAFLERAASLPAPPPKTRSSLDPTNVTVYPPGLFRQSRERSMSAGLGEAVERPRAFGLVRIPKLEECCGGRCGCPEETCRCGDACDGCCMGNGEGEPDRYDAARMQGGTAILSPSVSFAREVPPPPPLSAEPARSCCARQ